MSEREKRGRVAVAGLGLSVELSQAVSCAKTANEWMGGGREAIGHLKGSQADRRRM